MVYQEYPKCMYQGDATTTVNNEEEEAAHAEMGWKTAAEHFGYGAEPKAEKETKKKK